MQTKRRDRILFTRYCHDHIIIILTSSHDTLFLFPCPCHSPCNERTKKRQPDELRLPEQIIIMSESIYSNGLGRGVLSVEGGKMGKVNVG